MKRQLVFAPFLVPLVVCGQVAAVTTTFSQKILPLNCIFETINVGTGTLRYLTPAECGVLISHGPVGEENGNSDQAGCQPKTVADATGRVHGVTPACSRQQPVSLFNAGGLVPPASASTLPADSAHTSGSLAPVATGQLRVQDGIAPQKVSHAGLQPETVLFIAGGLLAAVIGALLLLLVL